MKVEKLKQERELQKEDEVIESKQNIIDNEFMKSNGYLKLWNV